MKKLGISFLIAFSTVAGAETKDPASASNPSTSSGATPTGVTQSMPLSPAPSPPPPTSQAADQTATQVPPQVAPQASAQTQGQVTTGEQPATATGAVEITESYLNVRDPFSRPAALNAKTVFRSELERYPADAYRFVGILTGPTRLKAMIVDPDGKTHFVSEKVRLGNRGGVIASIGQDTIRVREKSVNLVGQEESTYTELHLPSSNSQDFKKAVEQKIDLKTITGSVPNPTTPSAPPPASSSMQGGGGISPISMDIQKVAGQLTESQRAALQKMDPKDLQKLVEAGAAGGGGK